MAKKLRKLWVCLFVLVLLVLLPMQVFAANAPTNSITMSNIGNRSYYLNAATEGMPVSGTNVTVWTGTGHATQRWVVYARWLNPTLNAVTSAANQNVCLAASGSNCLLATYSVSAKSTQGIHLAIEGTSIYGLVLLSSVTAVTATGFGQGSNVVFAAPNGSSSQLWYWQR